MGLFSRFRKSSKSDEKEKHLSASEKREGIHPSKPAYHHVPTHAAIDALNGAPASWKKADNVKVREINKRKSQVLMFKRNSTMAEFLLNMPQLPSSELGTTFASATVPQWKRETARGRTSAFVPLELNFDIDPVRGGASSSEASPVSSMTSDTSNTSHVSFHITSVVFVASTFDFAYRARKRPHPRLNISAHNDAFTHLQSTLGRKSGETLPNDELFTVSPDKSEILSEYEVMNYYRQSALAGWAHPVLKQGPRHSVMKRQGGQRPPSVGIETVLE